MTGFAERVQKHLKGIENDPDRSESTHEVYVAHIREGVEDGAHYLGSGRVVLVGTSEVYVDARRRGEYRTEHWERNFQKLVDNFPFESCMGTLVLGYNKNLGDHIQMRWMVWPGDLPPDFRGFINFRPTKVSNVDW